MRVCLCCASGHSRVARSVSYMCGRECHLLRQCCLLLPLARKLFSYIQHTKCYMQTVHRTSTIMRQGQSHGILKTVRLHCGYFPYCRRLFSQNSPHCVEHNNGMCYPFLLPPAQLPTPSQPRFQDYNSYKSSLLDSLVTLTEMEIRYIMNVLAFPSPRGLSSTYRFVPSKSGEKLQRRLPRIYTAN
jgi:hypothetical protein